MSTTTTRPGYRNPWEHGAKAYPEADTPEALREGAKRKRKPLMVHLAHEGFGHLPCATCGIALRDPYAANQDGPKVHTDQWGTGHYNPRTKVLIVQHYYCSWSTLMGKVIALGRYINL